MPCPFHLSKCHQDLLRVICLSGWQPVRGDVRVLPSGKYLKEGPEGMTKEAHARLVQSYGEITGIIGDAYPVLET